MTTQWSTRPIGTNGALPNFDGKLLEEEVVILMQGKNTFGDRIYSYLKIALRDLMRMQAAVQAGQPFNPSDFGSVVAAGKGDPSDEVKSEVASMYTVMSPNRPAPPPPPPTSSPIAPRAWDEY